MNSVNLYSITEYKHNTATICSTPNSTTPEGRITGVDTPVSDLCRARVMAAQEIFRAQGPAIAYNFLASPHIMSWSLYEPVNNYRFTVGDRLIISDPGYPFVALQGFTLYNALTLLNKAYFIHRAQNSDAIVMNSVTFGDHLLNRIRDLPQGAERQETIALIVYLVTNGFFTHERIHTLFPDVEGDISHAKEHGIEHREILPFPLMDMEPYNQIPVTHPLGYDRRAAANYPPITKRIQRDVPNLIEMMTAENCRYLPEYFRAQSVSYETGEVQDRVTDEEIERNQRITRSITSRIDLQ